MANKILIHTNTDTTPNPCKETNEYALHDRFKQVVLYKRVIFKLTFTKVTV